MKRKRTYEKERNIRKGKEHMKRKGTYEKERNI
jgi:hypothetical protein